MGKWDGVLGTCNPKRINRKKDSLLWPNLESNIEVNYSYSVTFCCCWKSNDNWGKQLAGWILYILQTAGMNDILGIQCKGVYKQ